MRGSHCNQHSVFMLRVVRFGAAGLVSTVCYLVLANALAWSAGMSPLLASVVAYLISLVVSYLLQSRFTFGLRKDSIEQMIRFLCTSAVGLGLCWVITFVNSEMLGWPFFVGSFMICILIPMFNYSLFHAWVFAAELSRLQRKQNYEK